MTSLHASCPDCSLSEKLRFILSATYQHARNLAIFTALYKILTGVMASVRGCAGPLHHATAGAVCGYLVFGDDNKINMQVSGSHPTQCLSFASAPADQPLPVVTGNHSSSTAGPPARLPALPLLPLSLPLLLPSLRSSHVGPCHVAL